MTTNFEPTPTRDALYSRSTGRRLDPSDAHNPLTGRPVAVLVLDDGTSTALVGTSVIGRDPTSDRRVRHAGASPLAVDDESKLISRRHVMIRVSGWQIEVIDLGSRNGTFVEDESGTWVRCTPGLGRRIGARGCVRIGTTTMTIHHLGRAGRAPQPT